MKKKLVLVVPNLSGGGAEKVMVTLLQAIKDSTVEVTLVTVQKSGELVSQIPPEARVVDLGVKQLRYAPLKLIKALNKLKPDVILSTLTAMNLLLLSVKSFLTSKPKIVVRETNPPAAKYKDNKRMKLLYQMLYKRADRIIAISKGVADDLISYAHVDPRNVKVIYNPIHIRKIRHRMKESTEHEWLNQADVPILLAIGRLVEQKDFGTLLKAFATVRAEQPSKLIILGEGQQKEMLRKQAIELGIDQDVLFDGFKENPYPYLKRADLFVLSSKWEGFGLVIAEALATETPIVATDCSGAPAEILENGTYGLLVQPGNPQMLAEAMLQQLRNPLQRNLLARAESFDVVPVTQSYLYFLLKEW